MSVSSSSASFDDKLKEAEAFTKTLSADLESKVANVRLQLESVKIRVQEHENLISKLKDCMTVIQHNRNNKRRRRSLSEEQDILYDKLRGIKRLKTRENNIIDAKYGHEHQEVEEFGLVEETKDFKDVEGVGEIEAALEIDEVGQDFQKIEVMPDVEQFVDVKWFPCGDGNSADITNIAETSAMLTNNTREDCTSSQKVPDWKWVKEENDFEYTTDGEVEDDKSQGYALEVDNDQDSDLKTEGDVNKGVADERVSQEVEAVKNINDTDELLKLDEIKKDKDVKLKIEKDVLDEDLIKIGVWMAYSDEDGNLGYPIVKEEYFTDVEDN